MEWDVWVSCETGSGGGRVGGVRGGEGGRGGGGEGGRSKRLTWFQGFKKIDHCGAVPRVFLTGMRSVFLRTRCARLYRGFLFL